jgi:uncharacterized protein (UPF0335 family)
MYDAPANGTGHNVGGLAGDRLKSLIERIERLNEEKAALTADTREVFAEARSAGFDVKIMREIIKERKLDAEERNEREHLIDLYRHALGMLADTPLGEAAVSNLAAG